MEENNTMPEIITLCGSTKFKDKFMEVARKLTLKGKIVILPGVFGHADNEPITPEQKRMLDDLHLRKIDMSNSIYVINSNGYIGESTMKEIEYAKKHEKKIMYHTDN